jgi:hypothetical protein
MGDRSPKDKNKKKKQEEMKHQREQNQKVIQMNDARSRHNPNGGNNNGQSKDGTTDFKKAS